MDKKQKLIVCCTDGDRKNVFTQEAVKAFEDRRFKAKHMPDAIRASDLCVC